MRHCQCFHQKDSLSRDIIHNLNNKVDFSSVNCQNYHLLEVVYVSHAISKVDNISSNKVRNSLYFKTKKTMIILKFQES